MLNLRESRQSSKVHITLLLCAPISGGKLVNTKVYLLIFPQEIVDSSREGIISHSLLHSLLPTQARCTGCTQVELKYHPVKVHRNRLTDADNRLTAVRGEVG